MSENWPQPEIYIVINVKLNIDISQGSDTFMVWWNIKI